MPHIVQYQGSKRILAPQILQYMPSNFNRLSEFFAGMAAAIEGRAREYSINDINEPAVSILKSAVETPCELAERYKQIWSAQQV
jgi:DNA adenine methylase